VPGRERKDEIGALARTVQYFRDSLRDRQALQKDVDAQRTSAEARRAELETLITDFRLAVREALHQVNLHSEQMTLAADSLKTIATESSRRPQAAAASTSEASSNVNTVARAAEELSASIAEIESQVTRTRGVVLDASRVTAPKATERIAEHVEAIQNATSGAVEAIKSIAATMNQAEGFTAGIAVAVEEQAAATNEIWRSVAEAALGTQSAARPWKV
jgi:methyl-accepting chemotaxis protein